MKKWLGRQRLSHASLRTDEVSDEEVLRAIRAVPTHHAGITFHASTSNAVSTLHSLVNGTTTSITLPTFTTGDVYVLAFGTNDSSGTASTWAAPAGWTQVANSPVKVSSGTTFTVNVQLWTNVNASPNTTFTFTRGGTGGNDNSWVCFTMSGCDTTTPADSNPAAGATSTGSQTATVTGWNTINDGALPLVAAVDWNAGNSFTSTGYTGVTTANNANCELTLFRKNAAISPAGATGNIVVTDGAAAAGNGIVALAFALKAAAVVAGGQFPPFLQRQNPMVFWTDEYDLG